MPEYHLRLSILYNAEWCIAQARLCAFFVLLFIPPWTAGWLWSLLRGRDLAGRGTEIAGGIYPHLGAIRQQAWASFAALGRYMYRDVAVSN